VTVSRLHKNVLASVRLFLNRLHCRIPVLFTKTSRVYNDIRTWWNEWSNLL